MDNCFHLVCVQLERSSGMKNELSISEAIAESAYAEQ